MRAALITGREQIELRDFPEPEPVRGGAVVRIERCGICGTDVAAYRSGHPYAPFLCALPVRTRGGGNGGGNGS